MSNFGSIDKISSFIDVIFTCLNKTVTENIADKKINKINNVFLFILRKLFNLCS